MGPYSAARIPVHGCSAAHGRAWWVLYPRGLALTDALLHLDAASM